MIDAVLRTFDPVLVRIFPPADGLLPRLIGVTLIVLIAWIVAAVARWTTNHAARFEWLERVLTRSGVLSGLVEPSLGSSRRFAGGLLYWCILLSGLVLALAVWSESAALGLASFILILLPNSVLGALLILTASWLGRYWSRSVLIWMSNEGIALPWGWATLVRLASIAAGIALASEVTGFAIGLVRPSFLILLAGCTLAISRAATPLLRLHIDSFLSRETRSRRQTIEDPLS